MSKIIPNIHTNIELIDDADEFNVIVAWHLWSYDSDDPDNAPIHTTPITVYGECVRKSRHFYYDKDRDSVFSNRGINHGTLAEFKRTVRVPQREGRYPSTLDCLTSE